MDYALRTRRTPVVPTSTLTSGSCFRFLGPIRSSRRHRPRRRLWWCNPRRKRRIRLQSLWSRLRPLRPTTTSTESTDHIRITRDHTDTTGTKIPAKSLRDGKTARAGRSPCPCFFLHPNRPALDYPPPPARQAPRDRSSVASSSAIASAPGVATFSISLS